VEFEIFTLNEKPDYADVIDELSHESWPEFLLHGDVTNWDLLFDTFASFQIMVCDWDGDLLAVGHTVPFVWNGTVEDLPETISLIISRAYDAHINKQVPNTVSALAAMVGERYRRRGLSTEIIRQMILLASKSGCDFLIAPVRPTLKEQFPLASMDDYIQWTDQNGEAFDPWIRVHLRLGAEVLGVASCTLKVEGSVSDWEKWTGITFPESGDHIVPGALQPVSIDRSLDIGRYEDPNVWIMHHVISEGSQSA
jgi:hypothetical protein